MSPFLRIGFGVMIWAMKFVPLVHSFLWKRFLLVKAIAFINFIVFKNQLIAISKYLYTPYVDQVYKSNNIWEIWLYYFSTNIAIMRLILFQNFKRKMTEVAIGRCSSEIDTFPTPFWILKTNWWNVPKNFVNS